MELKTKLDLQTLQQSPNLVSELHEDDVDSIGKSVYEDYVTDDQSREGWKEKNKKANELALQVAEEKTYPWDGASNVKFPLLTIASLQFSSRAYPALVKTPDLVKMRTQGSDSTSEKSGRAQRVSAHMSYQMLEEDESWEEEQDKLFMALPIAGTVFKKTYYDHTRSHNVSECVLPLDLVVHYYAKSLEKAGRYTHVISMYQNEIRERQLRGLFAEIEDLPEPQMEEPKDADKREGIQPPVSDSNRPRVLLEQHTWLDLDGDGYKEPYVVTVDRDTQKVFRILNCFQEVTTEQNVKIDLIKTKIVEIVESLPKEARSQQDLEIGKAAEKTVRDLQAQIESLKAETPTVLKISRKQYFTKYGLIPSPDGGFYDLGFGSLLSPLNDSVNTLINQLIDSGSINNGSVGFIGKGARIKGGKVRFSPNEWKRVDVPGATLKDALVPLPTKPPSPVLFQLLGLLINYTERVSSVTDAMSGQNPGQNTPAYNMSAMLEQGLQVFNGIFKRIYRSFRSEIRKWYQLNSMYLDSRVYFEYQDNEYLVSRGDYTGDTKDLIPAADPNAFSSKEKQMKSMFIAERSTMVPGYDPIKVEQSILEAHEVPNAQEVFPTVQNEETGAIELAIKPPPNPETVIKEAEERRKTLEAKDRGEQGWAKIEIDAMVAEATVIEKGEKIDMEQLKLIQKEASEKRKDATEREKIDENKQRDARAVEGKSGNGSSS